MTLIHRGVGITGFHAHIQENVIQELPSYINTTKHANNTQYQNVNAIYKCWYHPLSLETFIKTEAANIKSLTDIMAEIVYIITQSWFSGNNQIKWQNDRKNGGLTG